MTQRLTLLIYEEEVPLQPELTDKAPILVYSTVTFWKGKGTSRLVTPDTKSLSLYFRDMEREGPS